MSRCRTDSFPKINIAHRCWRISRFYHRPSGFFRLFRHPPTGVKTAPQQRFPADAHLPENMRANPPNPLAIRAGIWYTVPKRDRFMRLSRADTSIPQKRGDSFMKSSTLLYDYAVPRGGIKKNCCSKGPFCVKSPPFPSLSARKTYGLAQGTLSVRCTPNRNGSVSRGLSRSGSVFLCFSLCSCRNIPAPERPGFPCRRSRWSDRRESRSGRSGGAVWCPARSYRR